MLVSVGGIINSDNEYDLYSTNDRYIHQRIIEVKWENTNSGSCWCANSSKTEQGADEGLSCNNLRDRKHYDAK